MTLEEITNIQFENRSEGLACLSHKSQVKFAIYCAKLVTHLDTTTEGPIAIACATKWLNGEATADDCDKASYSAYAASASEANAVSRAASNAAAYAANSIHSTHTSSSNASYAAHSACNAGAYVDDAILYKQKMIKQLQFLLSQEQG